MGLKLTLKEGTGLADLRRAPGGVEDIRRQARKWAFLLIEDDTAKDSSLRWSEQRPQKPDIEPGEFHADAVRDPANVSSPKTLILRSDKPAVIRRPTLVIERGAVEQEKAKMRLEETWRDIDKGSLPFITELHRRVTPCGYRMDWHEMSSPITLVMWNPSDEGNIVHARSFSGVPEIDNGEELLYRSSI